jgi:hypothetical protein
MSTRTTYRMDVERLLSPCGPICKERSACAAAAKRIARGRTTWLDGLAGMSG